MQPVSASHQLRCRKCGRQVAPPDDTSSFIVLDGLRTDEAPICAECAQAAASELRRAVSELRDENDSYSALLAASRASPAPAAPEEEEVVEDDDARLTAEEAALAVQVERVRKAIAELESKREAAGLVVTERSLVVEALESAPPTAEMKAQALWRVTAAVESAARVAGEEQGAVAARLARSEAAVERLKRASVANEAFRIAHSGHVATINELRLGRVPPAHDTDWSELNAAFGCTCQLVHLLGRLLGVTFSAFVPVPLGSVSRMEAIADRTPYELYGSADVSLSRFFWYRRFDTAQVALASCTAQLADACERRDSAFKVPYRITPDGLLYSPHQGTDSGVSVRLQFNSAENWSRALKYLLTNLKSLLTRVV